MCLNLCQKAGAEAHHGDHGEQEQGQLPAPQEGSHDGQNKGREQEAQHP